MMYIILSPAVLISLNTAMCEISVPLQQSAPLCMLCFFRSRCEADDGRTHAAKRTMAAPMQQSRAVERPTRGPLARRRLGLYPLLPWVVLRLYRSCSMPPGPTDTWWEAAYLLGRFAERGRGA